MVEKITTTITFLQHISEICIKKVAKYERVLHANSDRSFLHMHGRIIRMIFNILRVRSQHAYAAGECN